MSFSSQKTHKILLKPNKPPQKLHPPPSQKLVMGVFYHFCTTLSLKIFVSTCITGSETSSNNWKLNFDKRHSKTYSQSICHWRCTQSRSSFIILPELCKIMLSVKFCQLISNWSMNQCLFRHWFLIFSFIIITDFLSFFFH